MDAAEAEIVTPHVTSCFNYLREMTRCHGNNHLCDGQNRHETVCARNF